MINGGEPLDQHVVQELALSLPRFPGSSFWSGTGWYEDFRAGDDHVGVFAGKVFRYPRGDQDGRAGAMDYGRPTGVPEHQLDWPD